jgi:hypothetical protein
MEIYSPMTPKKISCMDEKKKMPMATGAMPSEKLLQKISL